MLSGRFAIVVGAIEIALASPARASPRSDPTEGRAVFTGATSPSATSIDVNPAALGGSTYDEVYVAATSVLEQYGIDQHALDIASGALTAGPKIRDLELSPGATIAGLFHVLKTAVVAAELRTPPGEAFPSGQTALGYSTLGGGQRDYYATLAVSAKVTDDIYIGASIGLERNTLSLHFLRDTALAGGSGAAGIGGDCGGSPCGVGNPAAAERYDINVATPVLSIAELTGTFGGMVQLARDVWLGAAFHFPPGSAVQSELDGTATLTQAPRVGGATVKGDATVYYSEPASVDAELRARLAGDLDLHVGGRWEDLSRLSSYDVRVYGAELATAGAPEWQERAIGLHDEFALWTGVEQEDHGETWRFGARVGYETASVDDNRISPMTIAGQQFTLDLGAQWRATNNIIFQLSYGFSYFPSVDVTKSAFDPRSELNCIASGYNYALSDGGCADLRNGYAQPSADGDYQRMEHALRLGFRYEFGN